MTRSRPFFEQVQAHYDLSDEFFALFLDPSMTYSCAYFQREDMTLEEAQRAKIDLSLGKCDLRPGMRLLDIGCGWGATAMRAAERFGVNVVGLTLSRHQHEHDMRMLAGRPGPGVADRIEFRLQGWEEFDEPVDRIVSIGAFEHFRTARHADFFARCRAMLPPRGDGRMLLHTIVQTDWDELRRGGIEVTHADVLFAKFIRERIFPGGQLCTPQIIIDHAQRAGFDVIQTQSLRLHYAKTLDIWATNLQAAQQQATSLTGPEVVETYLKYLTGCANYFRSGHNDIMQFTCACAA
jgi:cyclopropane-fatty-acyl-phospholipid synthase